MTSVIIIRRKHPSEENILSPLSNRLTFSPLSSPVRPREQFEIEKKTQNVVPAGTTVDTCGAHY